MTCKIIESDKPCHYCGKVNGPYTYWPNDQIEHKYLLCHDCSEAHLTAEGHKERTGLTSYKKRL